MPFTIESSSRVVAVSGGTGPVTANTWAISRMRWVSPSATSGDTCAVNDGYGNPIWQSVAQQTAPWSEETDFAKEPPIAGISVATLTSGTLFIMLR